MFAQSFITLIAASAAFAAPTTKLARDDLKPWQITSFITHEPSGRPGNDPHSYLRFSIEDPNTITAAQTPTGQAVFPPTSAECSLQWLTNDDVAWGVEQPCVTEGNTTNYSTWTFTINKTGDEQSDAATDFNLAFKVCYSFKECSPKQKLTTHSWLTRSLSLAQQS